MEFPIDWNPSSEPFNNRSWLFHFNSWLFMDDLLNVEIKENIRFAKDIALDWIRYNIRDCNTNPFAWYDMAVGCRAIRLAFIIERSIRYDLVTLDELKELSLALNLHIKDLCSEDKFSVHSNHGMYQLCGLLGISKILPEVLDSHILSTYAETNFLNMQKMILLLKECTKSILLTIIFMCQS